MFWEKLGSSWRVVAVFNAVVISLVTIFGAFLVYWGVSESGSIEKSFVFFRGSCKTSKSVNIWLHLLLNAFSTGVLASSNFFMQVLSSPTRSEINRAHKANRALKIGVQSLRNVFWTSKIKFVCWILFFVSSFPLHLFFNSAIFATEYLGTDWNLTIASEGFINGAQYFGPGAALWPPRDGDELYGYGSPGNLDNYLNSSSNTFKKIQEAAQEAKRWRKLETRDCLSQYVFCNPRTTLGDVVMVVESQNKSFMADDNDLGWRRDKLLLPFSSDEAKSYWDEHVPLRENNSLWFSADCKTTVSLDDRRNGKCTQTCGRAVGLPNSQSKSIRPGSMPSIYTIDFFSRTTVHNGWPGLANDNASKLNLKYCLAREISQDCKVGISNQLLMIVVISIAVKGFLCVAVLLILPKEQPLVVPGDAIESFICFPDEHTAGRCLLDRDLEEEMGAGYRFAMTAAPARRSWISAIDPQAWARSYGILSMDIVLLAIMFAIAHHRTPLDGQSLLQSMNNGILSVSGASAAEIINSVLRANLPHLLLSISYFIYNNIYTYLCAEKEWNSYGGDFRPLRVSQPKGQQRTTYRLQLPYRYSVPLIVVSVFMHWLISNAIYVFVLEGDYYELGQLAARAVDEKEDSPETGLSKDAYVGLGYSTLTILVLLIATIVLPIIPTLIAQRKVKTSMPLAGASSMVISAACHVPILEGNVVCDSRKSDLQRAVQHESALVGDNDDSICEACEGAEPIEMQELLVSADLHIPDSQTETTSNEPYPKKNPASDVESYLREVARNPVRWGVVKTTASWNEHYTDPSITVRHLSFGTEDHDVQEPAPGQWYA
ncbi:hypothetical protein LCI18_013941 [Fusarium solani-melongenae]|uniref:Uncharacterized protein n=1 Tax=Fusarium solani subsp. cucurbitae TaxID=2747967 RepID=A0ACD3ZPJ7_FUSSC|nr:hypothetical protein LCI18_013941 [Fusarium solani-melongenae]